MLIHNVLSVYTDTRSSRALYLQHKEFMVASAVSSPTLGKLARKIP